MGHFLEDFIGDLALDADGNPVVSPRGGLGKWGRSEYQHVFTGWHHAGPGNGVFHRDYPPKGAKLFHKRLPEPEVSTISGRTMVYESQPRCEMCEAQHPIFIHRLVHPNFPRPMYVGEDCAGHMIGDPYEAAEREKDARGALKCRAVWEQRSPGKWVANTVGFNLAVVRRSGGRWAGWYVHKPTSYKRASSQRYTTPEEAKRWTVLAMIRARRNRPWPKPRPRVYDIEVDYDLDETFETEA